MAAAVAKERGVRGLGSERLREALVGYGFIALPMAFFFLFFIFPIGYAVYISRYDWSIFKGPFVGWDNYRELYHDEVFWRHAVRNTLVFTAFVVPWRLRSALRLRSSSTRRSAFGRSSAPPFTFRRWPRRQRSSRSRPTSSPPTAS